MRKVSIFLTPKFYIERKLHNSVPHTLNIRNIRNKYISLYRFTIKYYNVFT